MSLEWKRKIIRPMHGGMVTAKPGKYLKDNEYQLLENFLFRDGELHKRHGVSQLNNNAGLSGNVIGLFRFYKSDGDRYNVAITIDDVAPSAELLAKKNDTITTVNWSAVDTALNSYAESGIPAFFFADVFGEKLVFTDGLYSAKFFEGQDSDNNWIWGELGAFPPHRQMSIDGALWDGDPVVEGGFVQYCQIYAYEDENGKVTYSNPSPRSSIYALDWMGEGLNGYYSTIAGELGDQEINPDPAVGRLRNVGPTKIDLSGLSIGTEHMASATDFSLVKRVIRRHIFRRHKRFADDLWKPWEEIGFAPINKGQGAEGFVDNDTTPTRTPLSTDNNPPPIAKYPLAHKNRMVFFNYKDRVIEAPYDQADVAYKYYQSMSLEKRALMTVKNNTDRGFTDAIVRLQLQWSDANAVCYIDYDDNGIANPERNFLFTDDDGITVIPHYRESYNVNTDAVFVLRIPELPAGGSARIYVYYNSNVAIGTDPSDWEEVFHRRYASRDMRSLYNFDDDYPMRNDDHLAVDRINLSGSSPPAVFWSFDDTLAPPCNDEAAKTGDTLGEQSVSIDDEGAFIRLYGFMANVEGEGCIQFWVKGANIGGLTDGHIYTLVEGRTPNEFTIRYAHATVENDRTIEILWHDEDNVARSTTLDFATYGNSVDLSDNVWTFISLGWGGTNRHIYIRRVGLDSAISQPANLTGLTKGSHSRLGKTNVGVLIYEAFQAYYSDLVQLSYLPSIEELRVMSRRCDLDTYFWDEVTGGHAGAGWNLAGATASMDTSDIIAVGVSENEHRSGLIISDNDNPHTYPTANYRDVGQTGDVGTGIIDLGGHMYCYKHNSIYRIRTDGPVSAWLSEDGPVDESKTIGCVAPMTLKLAKIRGGQVIISLADNGLYAYDGLNQFIELSQPIKDVIQSLTGEQKSASVGAYWGKYGIYLLAIGTTAAAGANKLARSSPSAFVPDTVYAFHLDTVHVTQDESGGEEVHVLISKWDTNVAGNDFSMGYPCSWLSGEGMDNGEFLFGNSDGAYIYVLGERTGTLIYKDDWAGSDITIPISLRLRQFWHRSALFRGFRPFYRAQHLSGGVLTWYNNRLKATPRSYDELGFASGATDTPTTHSIIPAVISGGHDGGLLYRFPKTARGEWMDILFEDNDGTNYSDGDIIWRGLEYEFAELPGP